MIKRFLALILSLALVLSLLTVSAQAFSFPDLTGKVIFLHTNDVHGSCAAEGGSSIGYSGLLSLKKDFEAMGAQVFLLDAGDFSQGKPLVNLSNGANAVAFMNQAGYVAAAIGNHEFDWSLTGLNALASMADFPLLSANIIDASTGETPFPASITLDTCCGKVGIFGLTPPETITSTRPDHVKGLTFLADEELYACAQQQADALRADGCVLVICLSHLGIEEASAPNRSSDVAEHTTGIDLFIDGHSHSVMDGGAVYGSSLITSTGISFANAGVVLFDGANISCKLISAEKYTAVDEALDCAVNEVKDEISRQLDTPIATTSVFLNGNRNPGVRTGETNLGDFASDACLWAARNALGDHVVAAITNGGGIRTSIDMGEITMNTLKTVFPFSNTLVTVPVTGAELLEVLEAATQSAPNELGAFPQVSGISYKINTAVEYEKGEQYPDSTYCAPANPGSRVTILTVGGQPWEADASYVIAVSDFLAAGGDTYYVLKNGFDRSGVQTGVALEEALAAYVTEELGGVIGDNYAQPAGRIIIK